MKNVDTIRAWKDESYRNSLSDAQRSQLAANPAGQLSEEAQTMISGGDYMSGIGNGPCDRADECYPE